MLKIVLNWLMSDGPRWRYNRIWLHALLAALGLTAAICAVYSALGATLDEIFAENAVHEMAQSVLLAIAVLAGGVAAVRCTGLSRYSALATGLISYIGFVRETPSCQGDIVLFCASSDTRAPLIAIGAVILLAVTLVTEFRARGTVLKAIHPRVSWPLALVAASIGASQVSDDLHLVVLEETLELYAYMVLMFAALWLWRAASPRRNVHGITASGSSVAVGRDPLTTLRL